MICFAGDQLSSLIYEIADQDYIVRYGAAGHRQLFSVTGPGEREDVIRLEVGQLSLRSAMDRLADNGRRVSVVHIGQRVSVRRPTKIVAGKVEELVRLAA